MNVSFARSMCGAGLTLSSHDGFEIFQAIRFTFPITNNEAEYEALLAGMELGRNLDVKHLKAFRDSILVVKDFYRRVQTKGSSNKGIRDTCTR